MKQRQEAEHWDCGSPRSRSPSCTPALPGVILGGLSLESVVQRALILLSHGQGPIKLDLRGDKTSCLSVTAAVEEEPSLILIHAKVTGVSKEELESQEGKMGL